ncbi:MAG: DUF3021 domain-containing protein [Lachnospiraceae bacterium]|nr:DUF3021 domain-containing protein [Lachnospiraceae bacterium]
MDIKNRCLTKSLAGTVIGILVGVFFWMISGRLKGDRDNLAFLIHLAMSALLGAVAMGSSVVYEIESWGTLRATATHYLLVMFDFVIVSIILKWFPNWLELVIMLIIMTVIYAGIWISELLYWKKTIRKMNEQLNNIRE